MSPTPHTDETQTLPLIGELELLEQVFGLLRIKGVTPLGLSQQFEAQRSLPDKFFCVEGSLQYRFHFRVEATARASQEEWLSAEVRVCPTNFLN